MERFKSQKFAFVTLLGLFLPALSLAEEVDLELVLAMDASGSISEAEYVMQLEGTADALVSPEIVSAIQSGPIGRVAISILLWSDASFPKVSSGWYVLDDDASIVNFAQLVRTFKLTSEKKMGVGGGGTGIGAGVAEAVRLIEENQYNGFRKTIDVSGDGIETEFWFSKPPLIRDAKKIAERNNVTINGLPIITPDFPDLDAYYREQVISGIGSFVLKANGFEDFARAIRRKLWLEIANPIAQNNVIDHDVRDMAHLSVGQKNTRLR